VHRFPEQRQFEILMKTPKAFANSSPGLERQRQPWEQIIIIQKTLKRVSHKANPFQGCFELRRMIPGFSLRSNPGLKLANAFGVISS
jgi:hypothetical protein